MAGIKNLPTQGATNKVGKKRKGKGRKKKPTPKPKPPPLKKKVIKKKRGDSLSFSSSDDDDVYPLPGLLVGQAGLENEADRLGGDEDYSLDPAGLFDTNKINPSVQERHKSTTEGGAKILENIVSNRSGLLICGVTEFA